jgi:hypothetical protein
MEPFHEQMAAIEDQLRDLEFHVDDGTFDEIHEQIREQMSVHMKKMEEIHFDMEPYMEQMQQIHVEMEGLHEEMAKIHIDMEPIHEAMADIHVDLEPLHDEMEKIHRAMEPFHEEMELLGDRMEKALEGQVIAVLQEELATVVAPGTPLDEAAALIAEDANINIDEDTLTFTASKRRTRQVLIDLLSDHRIGTQKNFDDAIENAASALSPLVIVAD